MIWILITFMIIFLMLILIVIFNLLHNNILMNVLKLLRISRLTRLPKNKLLAFFHKPSKIVSYVAIRYHNNSLYVDVAFAPNGRSNTTVRYKIFNRPFIDLYRKARCQNALKNFVLKYASL